MPEGKLRCWPVARFFACVDWVNIIGGFLRTLRTRTIETPDERMAWLLVVATIPTGILGLAFEHKLRTVFAKPLAAATFLTVNGVILFFGEWIRRRSWCVSSLRPTRRHAMSRIGTIRRSSNC